MPMFNPCNPCCTPPADRIYNLTLRPGNLVPVTQIDDSYLVTVVATGRAYYCRFQEYLHWRGGNVYSGRGTTPAFNFSPTPGNCVKYELSLNEADSRWELTVSSDGPDVWWFRYTKPVSSWSGGAGDFNDLNYLDSSAGISVSYFMFGGSPITTSHYARVQATSGDWCPGGPCRPLPATMTATLESGCASLDGLVIPLAFNNVAYSPFTNYSAAGPYTARPGWQGAALSGGRHAYFRWSCGQWLITLTDNPSLDPYDPTLCYPKYRDGVDVAAIKTYYFSIPNPPVGASCPPFSATLPSGTFNTGGYFGCSGDTTVTPHLSE